MRPNTKLDAESYNRATSVYLVDRVVPMLPEALSNELCSLRTQEEKLTFSAVFILDETGKVLNEWYGRTLIFSDYRFTYEEVQCMLESDKPEVSELASLTGKKYVVSNKVFNAIKSLNYYAKQLRLSLIHI